MPIYPYKCPSCGQAEDRYFSLADYDNLRDKQQCPRCESIMKRIITPPALKTTTRFMAGSSDGLSDDASRKIAYENARAAGINISGKKFHPGLCRRGVMFDPQAWYGNETEAIQKADRLGRNIEGSITHKTSARDSDLASLEEPYRVAPHIVKPYVDAEIEQEHGGKVTAKKRAEITAKHQDKHSGNKKPSGKVKLFGGS